MYRRNGFEEDKRKKPGKRELEKANSKRMTGREKRLKLKR